MSLTVQMLEARHKYHELVQSTYKSVSKFVKFKVIDALQHDIFKDSHYVIPDHVTCIIENLSDDDYSFEISGMYGHHCTCYPIKKTNVDITARSIITISLPLGDEIDYDDLTSSFFITKIDNVCKLDVKSNHYTGSREVYVIPEDRKSYLIRHSTLMSSAGLL